jgi:putative SOS response-associated peptidase YedK
VQASLSFTQITINADHHPLMKRFHRPEDENRMLVIVPLEHYDDWLNCPSDALARKLFQPYPAELLDAKAAPIQRKRKEVPQLSLFESPLNNPTSHAQQGFKAKYRR